MEALMKNITLALDEKIIQKGRKYASKHNLTLNSLVRKLLERTVEEDSQNWLEECFQLMDKVKITRAVRKWKREDLYRG
jgi:ribonuclease D